MNHRILIIEIVWLIVGFDSFIWNTLTFEVNSGFFTEWTSVPAKEQNVLVFYRVLNMFFYFWQVGFYVYRNWPFFCFWVLFIGHDALTEFEEFSGDYGEEKS